jgi:hypothetical protein
MTTIPQLAGMLQELLTKVADQLALATRFTQRVSKLTGSKFCQALVFSWLADPQATLAAMTQTAAALDVRISAQGLNDRFTRQGSELLRAVFEQALQYTVVGQPAALALWQRFHGIYIQDSSTIALADALADLWPGCGGNQAHTAAALKLQVQFDYCQGSIKQLVLQPGRAADRSAPTQDGHLPAGALRLSDLGFFKLAVCRQVAQDDAYWLSRLQITTAVYTLAGERVDLLRLFQVQTGKTLDQEILLGRDERLHCRLLAIRVPQDVADRRRQHLRDSARKKQTAVSALSLALAAWTILVTNVPPELLSLQEALIVMRCRWQIELLFKLWKAQGQIDEWRGENPWRQLCELYGKLLAMLVQHWIFLVSFWAQPDRSLTKAAQTVRKHALHLAVDLQELAELSAALAVIAKCLAAGCRINKRQGAPHTYQLLADLFQPPESNHVAEADTSGLFDCVISFLA